MKLEVMKKKKQSHLVVFSCYGLMAAGWKISATNCCYNLPQENSHNISALKHTLIFIFFSWFSGSSVA